MYISLHDQTLLTTDASYNYSSFENSSRDLSLLKSCESAPSVPFPFFFLFDSFLKSHCGLSSTLSRGILHSLLFFAYDQVVAPWLLLGIEVIVLYAESTLL